MSEKTTDNPRSIVPPSSLDLQSVAEAMVQLHIARRTLLIYPHTHEQVKLGVQRAHARMTRVLKNGARLSVTVMRNGLAVDGQALQSKGPACRDLAGVLKHYQIAMVTFAGQIEIKELARFLRLITVDREKLMAHGGIEAVARRQRLDHIRIKTMDYSKLQLTEERKIQRSDEKGRDGDSIWQRFALQMAATEDPAHMARMFNERQLDTDRAIALYQSLLNPTDNRDGRNRSSDQGLFDFQKMIKGLHPDLQGQFLAATFTNCGRTDDPSEIANLIDGLGAELILRMLAQANEAGERISPSLLAFVQKMGRIGVTGESIAVAQRGGEPARTIGGDKVASLLTPEQHETYVDTDYARLLDTLTAQAAQAAMDEDFNDQVAADLNDARINVHTGRAFTRLMAGSPDKADFRDWARQLTYLLDDLLESRSFGYLVELIQWLRDELPSGDPDRDQIAELVLDRFHDPQFVADAVDKARRTDGEIDSDALQFLIELGEAVAAELLEEIDPSETISGHGFYEKLLLNLGAVTAREALARIKDPRPDYVQRMVRIIRRVGDEDTVEQLKPLLAHDSMSVRMEALATLLKFNNKWGLIRLRELLDTVWSEEVRQAVGLAGRYGVREAVPQLIGYLQRRGEMDRKEAALAALGRIGDPSALPALKQLAHLRWTLNKKKTRRLQRVLYENLEGYALKDIKDLLYWGMRQREPAVRSACERRFRTSRLPAGAAGSGDGAA